MPGLKWVFLECAVVQANWSGYQLVSLMDKSHTPIGTLMATFSILLGKIE